jgi:hypothetical protein
MNLGELRALLRGTLASEASWPDGTLDRWVAAAVRLYSAHFPRRVRAVVALSAGTQAYAIPGGVSAGGVISVEHPAGEVPPQFLRCVAEWSDLFGTGAPCYAVRGVADDDATATGYIVFAETVSDGETAVIETWAPHPEPEVADDAAVLTVPAQHMEALTSYVEFAAHYELETDEAVVADGSTIVLAQLGEESRRAWNRYKEVMDRLAWLGGAQGLAAEPCWSSYGL